MIEYEVKNNLQFRTPTTPQSVCFHDKDGMEIGRLDLTSPMTFTGDADKSATVFFESIRQQGTSFQQRIAELEAERAANWPQVLLQNTDLKAENKALREAAQITYDWLMSDSIFTDYGQIEYHRKILSALLGVQT